MNSIQKLTELFSDFPGIGPRQARRFVYFLLTRNEAYLDEFTRHIRELKKDIQDLRIMLQVFSGQRRSLCTLRNLQES